jgi:hypothetical protein
MLFLYVEMNPNGAFINMDVFLSQASNRNKALLIPVILIKPLQRTNQIFSKTLIQRPEDHIHIRFLTSHGCSPSFEVKSIALISVSISSIDKVW